MSAASLRHARGAGVGLPIGAVIISLAAIFGSPAQHDRWTLWAIWGLLAASLVTTWGVAGIFSLGQTAMYGLGAYASGVVAINLGGDSGWSLVAGALAGVIIGTVFAALLGYFVFAGRVAPIDVAIMTLGTTLVLFVALNNTAAPRFKVGDAELGGFNGLVGVPQPRIGGLVLDNTALFVLAAGAAVTVTSALAVWRTSHAGRVAEAIRINARRAELLGYPVRRHQLQVFVIGGAVAGLAGALYSTWGRFDAPTLFSLQPAVLLIIWVLVGSRSSLVGAFVGVVVVEGLTSWLGGSQGEYSPIYLGVALIAVVLVLPNGLVDSVARLTQRMRRPTPLDDDVAAPDSDHDPAAIEKLLTTQPAGLSADSLHKNFGGVAAVTDVSLDLASTGMTCIIGPNGAGKSTVLALLSGLARATRGTIHLGQSEATAWTPARRARAGLALKTQMVGTFDDLTVRENLRLASAVRGRRHATERVQLVADAFGMERLLDRRAATLSHGDQQRLDIAMALATRPTVVLLDEPTAGLSATETERTAALLHVVARHAHVVVIDHDMTFIRMLAAPVVVMHLGRVLTAGEFHDVVGDQRVLDVYIGGGTHVAP